MPTGATAKPNDEFGPRRSAAIHRRCAQEQQSPFAWQDGRRLWILDGGSTEWVLAELLFEPQSCRYLEVRRSIYQWPREAVGALLGRTFVAGQQGAEDAARGLSEWFAKLESTR